MIGVYNHPRVGGNARITIDDWDMDMGFDEN